jgi:hypothetical protein
MVRSGLQYKPLEDEEREQPFAAAATAESGSLPTHFAHPTLRHRGQQAAATSNNSTKVLPDSHDYEPDESEVRSIQLDTVIVLYEVLLRARFALCCISMHKRKMQAIAVVTVKYC